MHRSCGTDTSGKLLYLISHKLNECQLERLLLILKPEWLQQSAWMEGHGCEHLCKVCPKLGTAGEDDCCGIQNPPLLPRTLDSGSC